MNVHPGMKQNRQNEQFPHRQVPDGWHATSFQIRTAEGWIEVDGMVRQPFGIDHRTVDEAGNMSWVVTHLPSGCAVVRRIRMLAVALAFVDRIAALTDWTARDIVATADLRERVRQALDLAYGDSFADRPAAVSDNWDSVA